MMHVLSDNEFRALAGALSLLHPDPETGLVPVDDIKATLAEHDVVGEWAITGEARVTAILDCGKGIVAAVHVTEGMIRRDDRLLTVRRATSEGVTVLRVAAPLSALKRFRKDVATVKAGEECGLRVDGWRLQPGDVLSFCPGAIESEDGRYPNLVELTGEERDHVRFIAAC